MSRRTGSWIVSNATLFALAALAARAALAAGTAADTGQIATHPGRGCDGRDASRLQNVAFPSLSALGHSTSVTAGFRIADDFTLSSTTQVDSITFYAWGGTSTASSCQFDDARIVIRDASPAGANSVVFGDHATNRFASCTFSNVYRDAETSPGNCSFPVLAVTATIGTELTAGTYWVDFELGESAVPETYVVPVTVAGQEGGCGSGCNAVRYNGTTWGTLNDASTPQDVKVVVNTSLARTIQDGDAVFARSVSSFDATPDAYLAGVAANARQDELFELGWAYRVLGDTRESFFPAPNSENYAGNSSQLDWTNVDGNGFAAQESTTIYDTGLGAYLLQEMELTNLSGTTPLTIDLFHAVDPDLADANDDDVRLAAWTPGRILESTDAGLLPVFHYLADSSASDFLVRPNGASDLMAILADVEQDDFDGSGAPAGPIDVTAGYQFPLVIPPGSSRSVLVVLAANFSAQCDGKLKSLYCDGFESSDRVPWSASVP